MKTLVGAIVVTSSLIFGQHAFAATYDDALNAARMDDARSLSGYIDQGLLPDTVDENGNSLLLLAAREGNLKVVELLVKRGAQVAYKNPAGDSALALAALQGHVEIVDTLLQAGAPVGNEGWTPLVYAAFNGHLAIVERMVERGAFVDQRAPNQATALMLAARNGHTDVVRYLLSKGADATLENDQGRTARSWALEKSNTDAAALIDENLKKRGIKPKPLVLEIK